MNNASMSAKNRPSHDAPHHRKIDSAAKQTSLEGLRPLVNQLNHYFEKTRHSSAPSRT